MCPYASKTGRQAYSACLTYWDVFTRTPIKGLTSDRPTQQAPHALDMGRLHMMLNIHTRFCDNIGIGFQISPGLL